MTSNPPGHEGPTTPEAPDPSAAASFTGSTGGPSGRRIGLVAAGAVALLVGAVATAIAAAPIPSGASDVPGVYAPAADPLLDENVAFDNGRFGGRAFRDITIRAISGSDVTLATDDGWTRTIAITDAVDLTKGGQDVALSDLQVGDQVRFQQTRNGDGSYTVTALAVVVPTISGEVSGVSSSGFKVTTRDGSVWTVAVNGSTTYAFGQGDGQLADVKDGEIVVVAGTTTGENQLTALSVRVAPDRAIGTVSAKTADTITIKQGDGSMLTIHVDADTTYRIPGVESASLADVAVDMRIGVSGRARADASIDADAVAAGNGRGFRFGGGLDGIKPGWGGSGVDPSSDGTAPTS